MPNMRTVCGAGLLVLGASHAPGAHAVRVDWTVDAGVEHNSNVGMEDTAPRSQYISRAGLGFTVTEDSSALRLLLTGRTDYQHYQDTYSDRLDATMRGRMDWMAVPERLHLTVEDTLTTRPVDGLVPGSPANRQRLNTFAAGPTLFFRLGATMQGAAHLRYIRNTAEESRELDATRHAGGVRAIHAFDATRRMSVNLEAETIDFDHDAEARDLDRLDVFLRHEVDLASLRLGADAGWTRLEYDDGEDLGEPLFRFDAAWTPGARNRYTLEASSQFSDASRDGRGAIDPAGGIPVDVPVGEVTPVSSQFKERRLELGWLHTGGRYTLGVTPFAYEARYVDVGTLDHDGRGLRIDATWSLRPTLVLEASLLRDRIDYFNLGDTNDSRRYRIGLRRQLTRHWSARLSWDRYERRMASTGSRIDQDAIYLSVGYANR